MAGRLNLKRHGIVGHLAADHQACLEHLGKAFSDVGDLPGVYKHAAYFGGLVGSAHPALDARVAAPAGTGPGQDGRQVASAKSDQRVIGVECGHHHLTDLALRHRIAGAWPHDLQDHALLQHQPLPRFGLISDQAQIGSGIALVAGNAAFGQPVTQRRGKGLARHQCALQAGQCDLHVGCFLDNDFQKTRRAYVAGRRQFGHGLNLLLGLTGATGKHSAAQRVCAGFHHGAGRHEVIAEAVVYQLAGPEAGGEHGACHAPVVFACAFGLVNGAGAGKNTRHVRAKAQRTKAPENVATAANSACRLLAL